MSSNQNYQMPQSPAPSPSPAPEPLQYASHPKKVGPIIAIAVAVVVIIAVAIYMYSSRYTVVSPTNEQAQTGANVNTVVSDTTSKAVVPQETLTPITNTKDDVDSLQSDLNASIKGLDSTGI